MKNKFFAVLASAVLGVTVSFGWSFQASAQNDPLPSWNDTSAKQAIIDFVGRVAKADGGREQVDGGRHEDGLEGRLSVREALNSEKISNWRPPRR